VFGGGGGVIINEEIEALHARGVARIYSPQDGQTMGLQGMIDHMIEHTHRASDSVATRTADISTLFSAQQRTFDQSTHLYLGRLLSAIENNTLSKAERDRLQVQAEGLPEKAPVLGITGTGGSGKSSVTDELIRRLRLDQRDSVSVALLAIEYA
jgi:methylmalonyl-CoA mutase